MAFPCALNCSQPAHTFGRQCIKQWSKQASKGKGCPLCRNAFDEMVPHPQLTPKASALVILCPHCEEKTSVSLYSQHLCKCSPYLKSQQKLLEKLVEQEKAIL
jgi:hypothetical protein